MGLGAYVKMPPIGGMYGFFTIGNGWAYLVGGLVGAFIIGICANLFVNFTEEETAAADDAVDDIDISFDEIEIK